MYTKVKRILLFSGGIDSYIAWHYLGKPPTLYFGLNSRYSERELITIRELVPKTILDISLDLRSREQGEKAYIPFRNLLLAAQAVHYSDNIIIAGVKDDMVRDKNEKAFEAMSSILSELEQRHITITSPFWEMTKEQIVKWYIDNVGPGTDLLQTFSCYKRKAEKNYCAQCPACFRKWNALWRNGVELVFEGKELMQEYYTAAGNGKYIEERCFSILEAIDDYRCRY